MLHWLYDSDLLRGAEGGEGDFLGRGSFLQTQPIICMWLLSNSLFGAQFSLSLVVAAVRLTFIISQHRKFRQYASLAT